mmetsp:Transcript_34383/g.102137  ORF Transcript_34383/g.102137 Transcript_34383/m.102137 type:complete len:109 (+) Transcript_34383:547-873(+)
MSAAAFVNEFHGGVYVDVLSPEQSAGTLSAVKVAGPQKVLHKIYDKDVKGYVFAGTSSAGGGGSGGGSVAPGAIRSNSHPGGLSGTPRATSAARTARGSGADGTKYAG